MNCNSHIDTDRGRLYGHFGHFPEGPVKFTFQSVVFWAGFKNNLLNSKILPGPIFNPSPPLDTVA